VRLCGSIFGRERASLVFGWVFCSHMLGAAVAAMGAGFSRDLLSSYVPAFMLSGALCLLAALAALAVPRGAPPVPAQPAGALRAAA
jgi:hypothetical protein